jgi:hypothetical protein
MPTILILMALGTIMGVYFRRAVLALCTSILVLWQSVLWISSAEFRITGLLMLVAYIFALQSGYLPGICLSASLEE